MATTERIYRLLVDASQATAQLNKLNATTSKMESGFSRMGSNINTALKGLAAGFTFAKIASEVKQAVDSMDDLSKAAQRVGSTTEALSALGYAAGLSGSSMKTLENALGKISLGMAGSNKETNKTAQAMERLGISVTNSAGVLRSSDEVFTDIAEAFSKMPDGANKSALAMELFGKAGRELVPLLNEGKDGLEVFRKEAEKFGIIVSSDAAKAAEVFNDNIDRTKSIVNGLSISFASGLLPVMNDFITESLAAKEGVSDLSELGFQVGKAFIVAANSLIILKDGLVSAGAVFDAVGKRIGLTLGFILDPPISTDKQANLERRINAFKEQAEIYDEEFSKKMEKANNGIISSFDSMTENLNKSFDEFKQGVEGSISKPIEEETNQAIEGLDKLKAKAESLAESLLTPFEKYEKELAEISKLRQNRLISEEIEVRALTKALLDFEKAQESLSGVNTELDIANKIREDIITPVEEYYRKRQEIVANAYLDEEEKILAINKALDDMNGKLEQQGEIIEDVKDKSNGMAVIWQAAITAGVNSFVDAIFEADFSFKNFARRFLQDVAKMIVQLQIMNAIKGTAFGADIFGTGSRMSGGFVGGGSPYIVGEVGPELFIPSSNGVIVPHNRLGGNTTVNVFNNTRAQATVTETKTASGGKRIDVMIEEAVNANLKRGSHDSMMSQTFGMSRRGF